MRDAAKGEWVGSGRYRYDLADARGLKHVQLPQRVVVNELCSSPHGAVVQELVPDVRICSWHYLVEVLFVDVAKLGKLDTYMVVVG